MAKPLNIGPKLPKVLQKPADKAMGKFKQKIKPLDLTKK